MPRCVLATAPVRTADVGGWTDTWFARTGAVCNVAVAPGVSVRAELDEQGPPGTVELRLGDRVPERFHLGSASRGDADPLLVAALSWVPLDGALTVEVSSAVPPGSGLGTSASVTVAVLAALHGLRGEHPDPGGLAAAAHRVEVGLGLQSGVQDQLAAAHGGVRLYDIDYPDVTAMTALDEIGASTLATLGARLVTVYLGSPHVSSAMHEAVIAELEVRAAEQPHPERRDVRSHAPDELLGPMRDAARQAMAALRDGDLDRYGRALRSHHEAQRRLHPGLIGRMASGVEAVAAARGARGWKVNGAGGEGGSMVVLGPEDPSAHRMLVETLEEIPGCRVLALQPSATGVQVHPFT